MTGTVGEERIAEASREHKPRWGFTLKKAVAEFGRDEGTDMAAGLTYYSVLSIFPALVAMVSLLGVFGKKGESAQSILNLLKDMGQTNAANTLKSPIEQMTQASGAGIALIIGVLGALWSASGYVGAFGRMMNRVYDVPEGRGFFKLRPVQLLLTLVCILGAMVVLVGMAVSGPLAKTLGDKLGLGSQAVTAWNIAKWPVILLIVIGLVAMLYHFTPNVRRPKFRILSPGAVIAILVWILASVAFAFYVANFGKYNKTYGALAGVIVFLLWIWLTNVALVFGAEVDAEAERSRQLQAGIAAEEDIQLPMRSTKKSDKAQRKLDKTVAEGRDIRMAAGGAAAGAAAGGAAGAAAGRRGDDSRFAPKDDDERADGDRPGEQKRPPSLINRWGEEQDEDDVKSPYDPTERPRTGGPRHSAESGEGSGPANSGAGSAGSAAGSRPVAGDGVGGTNERSDGEDDGSTRPLRTDDSATRPLPTQDDGRG